MGRVAFITGITGQDGSYLAEFLLGKGYEVFGLVRRTSEQNYGRIQHILGDVHILEGDLLDSSSLDRALQASQPDEVYNLAALSHVGASFKQPVLSGEINALGPVRILELLRGTDTRFYQASTSELFGNASQSPQNEATPFLPVSPYGIAKLYAHHAVRVAREAYGVFACSGILFNHESPRRGLDFVTRKITHGLAEIKAGKREYLELGNIEACRDWGYAGDYVEAMWLMLQQPKPDDFVIATGVSHSVHEFLVAASDYAQVPLSQVRHAALLERPAEVHHLMGDASKARRVLGWQPRVAFRELVAMMVQHDLQEIGGNYEDQLSSYPGTGGAGLRGLLGV